MILAHKSHDRKTYSNTTKTVIIYSHWFLLIETSVQTWEIFGALLVMAQCPNQFQCLWRWCLDQFLQCLCWLCLNHLLQCLWWLCLNQLRQLPGVRLLRQLPSDFRRGHKAQWRWKSSRMDRGMSRSCNPRHVLLQQWLKPSWMWLKILVGDSCQAILWVKSKGSSSTCCRVAGNVLVGVQMIWSKIAWGGLDLSDLKTPWLEQQWNDKLECPGMFTVVSMGFGHLVLRATILWLHSLVQRLKYWGAGQWSIHYAARGYHSIVCDWVDKKQGAKGLGVPLTQRSEILCWIATIVEIASQMALTSWMFFLMALWHKTNFQCRSLLPQFMPKPPWMMIWIWMFWATGCQQMLWTTGCLSVKLLSARTGSNHCMSSTRQRSHPINRILLFHQPIIRRKAGSGLCTPGKAQWNLFFGNDLNSAHFDINSILSSLTVALAIESTNSQCYEKVESNRSFQSSCHWRPLWSLKWYYVKSSLTIIAS